MIEQIKRVSRPWFAYLQSIQARSLKRNEWLGQVAIVSTSKGVMTDPQKSPF